MKRVAAIITLLAAGVAIAQEETLSERRQAERAAERRRIDRARSLERERASRGDVEIQWCDGHSAQPYRLVFGPDGKRLVSIGVDGRVNLWDTATGRVVARLGWHSASTGVTAHFTPDGTSLLTIDPGTGSATVWYAGSGARRARLAGDAYVVWGSTTPQGNVITVDDAGLVKTWTVRGRPAEDAPPLTVKNPAAIDVHEGAVVHKAMRKLIDWVPLSPGGEYFMWIDASATLRVWNRRTGTEKDVVPNGLHARWRRDGTYVVTDHKQLMHRSTAGEVLWTHDFRRGAYTRFSRDGRHHATMQAARVIVGATGRDEAPVPALTWDALRPPVATIGWSDPTPMLFVTHTGWKGRPAGLVVFDPATMRVARRRPLRGWGDAAVAQHRFALSPWGRTLAIVDQVGTQRQDVEIVDMATGEADTRRERLPTAQALAFSRDGTRLALSTYRGEMYQCRLDERRRAFTPFRSLSTHRVASAVLSEDGTMMASACQPHPGDPATEQVVLWSTGKDRTVSRIGRTGRWTAPNLFHGGELFCISHDPAGDGAHYELEAFSLDGKRRAAGRIRGDLPVLGMEAQGDRLLISYHGAVADLVDARTLKTVATLEGLLVPSDMADAPRSRLSPRGDMVAAAGAHHAVLLYDSRTGKLVDRLRGHRGPVRTLRFAPAGDRLVTASLDGSARVWEIDERKGTSLNADEEACHTACFSPDGRRILTGGAEGYVVVWTGEKPKPTHELEHARPVLHAMFSPDGKRILTADEGGTLHLWADDERLQVMTGHRGRIRDGGLTFSPDGRTIYSRGSDSALKTWSADTGRLKATRISYGGGGWLLFRPDGYYDGNAADRARLHLRGRSSALDGYRALLHSPERVAEAFSATAKPRTFELPASPTLEVVPPERPSGRFTVQAIAHDELGLGGLTVTQDGKPVESGYDGGTLETRMQHRVTLTMPRGATSTTVQLRVTNAEGVMSDPVTVVVRRPELPDLYVLAIAVGDYDDERLEDLPFATKDGRDMIARLEKEAGRTFKSVKTRTLFDAEVTQPALNACEERFLGSARPQDTIVVHVAGHGARSRRGRYYLMTKTTRRGEPTSGIRWEALERLVTSDSGLYARNRVLVLDTCFAGPARDGITSEVGVEKANALAGQGRHILAASTASRTARARDGNGVFTKALLAGLDGAADADGDGRVSVRELSTYGRERVQRETRGAQVPPAPTSIGDGEVVLSRPGRR